MCIFRYFFENNTNIFSTTYSLKHQGFFFPVCNFSDHSTWKPCFFQLADNTLCFFCRHCCKKPSGSLGIKNQIFSPELLPNCCITGFSGKLPVTVSACRDQSHGGIFFHIWKYRKLLCDKLPGSYGFPLPSRYHDHPVRILLHLYRHESVCFCKTSLAPLFNSFHGFQDCFSCFF